MHHILKTNEKNKIVIENERLAHFGHIRSVQVSVLVMVVAVCEAVRSVVWEDS